MMKLPMLLIALGAVVMAHALWTEGAEQRAKAASLRGLRIAGKRDYWDNYHSQTFKRSVADEMSSMFNAHFALAKRAFKVRADV